MTKYIGGGGDRSTLVEVVTKYIGGGGDKVHWWRW